MSRSARRPGDEPLIAVRGLHTTQIAQLVHLFGDRGSCGMAPNGSPRKSASAPTRITRRPLAATWPPIRRCRREGTVLRRSPRPACRSESAEIWSGESIGVSTARRATTRGRGSYIARQCDLNTDALLAMSARRTRRMSSLFPRTSRRRSPDPPAGAGGVHVTDHSLSRADGDEWDERAAVELAGAAASRLNGRAGRSLPRAGTATRRAGTRDDHPCRTGGGRSDFEGRAGARDRSCAPTRRTVARSNERAGRRHRRGRTT